MLYGCAKNVATMDVKGLTSVESLKIYIYVPYTSALSDFLFSAVVYTIQNLYFFSDLRRQAEKN